MFSLQGNVPHVACNVWFRENAHSNSVLTSGYKLP